MKQTVLLTTVRGVIPEAVATATNLLAGITTMKVRVMVQVTDSTVNGLNIITARG